MTLSKINVFYLTPLFPSHQQAKLLSVEFKQISAEEREKWDKLAREDKERYQREMEDYEPPSDDEEEVTKKKRKKDPNAPKRNMSAYFLFSQEVRPSIREENPQASFGEIAKVSQCCSSIFLRIWRIEANNLDSLTKLISAKFKLLDTEERAKYDKLAVEDKERYQKAMRVYRGEESE